MGIILAIGGVCIALFSVGLTFYSLAQGQIALQAAMPSLYVSSFITNAYLITAWFLMIGAVTFCLVFGIGRIFIKYKVIWHMPILDDWLISFNLAWWKKIILLGILPDIGGIRAEVRYKYGEDEAHWQHRCVTNWKRRVGVEESISIGSKISVRGEVSRIVTIFEYTPNKQIFTMHADRHPLPDYFRYKVSLFYDANDKPLDKRCGSFQR